MDNDDQQFREFEHTGDLGIELNAPTRAELFRRAALALAAILVDRHNIKPAAQRDLTVEADNDTDLMHDLLTALLGLFTIENFIWCDAAATEAGNGLRLIVKGESFDSTRHWLNREVKAVTYHQLSVTESAYGWHARIIFDV